MKVKDELIFPGKKFCYLLKDNETVRTAAYSIVDFDWYSSKLENSIDYPLTLFTTPSGLIVYEFMGIVYSGPPEHIKIYDLNYRPTTISGAVNDVRQVYLVHDLTLISGSIVDGYGAYEATAGRDSSLKLLPITSYSPEDYATYYILPSGIALSVETSNAQVSPYFFLAGNGTFFQRNPYASVFTDYSAMLPMSNIWVIRLDDLV
jgi:hypothetical protein